VGAHEALCAKNLPQYTGNDFNHNGSVKCDHNYALKIILFSNGFREMLVVAKSVNSYCLSARVNTE
jgi:hypothetical protein